MSPKEVVVNKKGKELFCKNLLSIEHMHDCFGSPVICSFCFSLNKHLPNACSVPDSVPGVGEISVNKVAELLSEGSLKEGSILTPRKSHTLSTLHIFPPLGFELRAYTLSHPTNPFS
jgi:hypothetical protein